MSVMSAYFCDLLFVALDTPESPDVVSIDEAVLFLISLGRGESRNQTA